MSFLFFFLMIRRPPRSTRVRSSAASDVYKRQHQRPIGDLVDALRQLGCQIDYLGQEGFPPLRIGQPHLKLDTSIRVRGDVSSQFLTALLMALPLVARQDIV